MKNLLFLLAISGAFSAEIAPALDSETKVILKTVSQRYKKLGNWSAKFTQETYSVGLGSGSFDHGVFHFVAPEKFRFSLVEPSVSEFISDGKNAWYINYSNKKRENASVQIFENIQNRELNRYLLLLRGLDMQNSKKAKTLLSDFEIKGHSKDQNFSLELIPKNSPEIRKITLQFENKETPPMRFMIEDATGNTTTITIMSWENIKKVDPKWFLPDYPKNAKVIR